MEHVMYFETTMHASRPVDSAAHAATLIHNGDRRDFDALIWTGNGRRLAVVADNHCNNPWLEVAVIDLDNKIQIESITAGWCNEEQLRHHLETCETTDFLMRRNVTLPLDNDGAETPATFECGCCGSGFESTYAKQRKYDQDNGYGICSDCAHYYGG